MQRKDVSVSLFSDEAWLKRLAYLGDILNSLNKCNLTLQISEVNILQFKDVLCSLLSKIKIGNEKSVRATLQCLRNFPVSKIVLVHN